MATEIIDWTESPSSAARNGVVSVGNFDGVHRGHAALIRRARQLADDIGGPVTVLTFDPHPLQLLAPERYQPPLTAVADRAAYLHEVGADAVVILKTTPEILSLHPDEFFQRILIGGFQARGVVEGFNFRFGHDRSGTIETLRESCSKSGISFHVADPFQLEGVTVSSSRVRDALLAGKISDATELMNRLYRIRGVVGTGAKRGRAIGFPTANLESVETLLPAEGVYAVRAVIGDRRYLGAANIGPNPTFGEHSRKIEVHLIDFDGDLYGQSLAVEFMERLRETRKFNSVEELIGQLRQDVEAARRLLR